MPNKNQRQTIDDLAKSNRLAATPESIEQPIETIDAAEETAVVEAPQAPVTVINLLRDYGGRRTNEQRIPPGLYKIDDPRLMGLGQYLIDSGHAVGINAQ